MSDTHELKTHPAPFKALLNGYKKFELRRDDGRGFKLGDTLVLREWHPDTERLPDGTPGCGAGYTGRSTSVEVTYIVRAPNWGLTDKMCVMSVKVISPLADVGGVR